MRLWFHHGLADLGWAQLSGPTSAAASAPCLILIVGLWLGGMALIYMSFIFLGQMVLLRLVLLAMVDDPLVKSSLMTTAESFSEKVETVSWTWHWGINT